MTPLSPQDPRPPTRRSGLNLHLPLSGRDALILFIGLCVIQMILGGLWGAVAFFLAPALHVSAHSLIVGSRPWLMGILALLAGVFVARQGKLGAAGYAAAAFGGILNAFVPFLGLTIPAVLSMRGRARESV